MTYSNFIINTFGLNYPCNETALNLVLLYGEVIVVGFLICIIVIDNILSIISSRMILQAVNFASRIESFIDLVFLLLPSSIVVFILVPTIGFLYSNEYNLDMLNYSLVLEVTGHQ